MMPSSRCQYRDWSVVIPCYHPCAAWLAQAIHSAIAAGCYGRNIILVSDDPGDHSTEAIAEAFTGVRVVRHAANHGVAAARRTGLRAVSTAFVTFLDQDDHFTSAMAQALGLARTGASRTAVVGGVAIMGPSGTISRYRQRTWPTRTMRWTTANLDLMLESAQIGRWVIPTDIALQCDFTDNRDIDDASDLAFVSAVAGICDVTVAPDTVLVYRQHADQVSAQPGSEMTETQERMLEVLLISAARNRFTARAVRRRLRSRRHCRAAARTRQEGATLKALTHLIAAVGSDITMLGSPIARNALLFTTGSIVKDLLATGWRRGQ